MLKIKDDVDLKELEKFGFVFINDEYVFYNDYRIDVVKIDIETREIISLGDKKGNIVLYDLIKTDLVEKVEDLNDKNN